jgi:hypothetical protein
LSIFRGNWGAIKGGAAVWRCIKFNKI